MIPEFPSVGDYVYCNCLTCLDNLQTGVTKTRSILIFMGEPRTVNGYDRYKVRYASGYPDVLSSEPEWRGGPFLKLTEPEIVLARMKGLL